MNLSLVASELSHVVLTGHRCAEVAELWRSCGYVVNGHIVHMSRAVPGGPHEGRLPSVYIKLARTGTVWLICVLACAPVWLSSSAAADEPQMTITATEGKPFSGQVADIHSLVCPVEDLRHEDAAIVWGDDPTTAGTVSVDQAGTGLSVSGTHTYLAAGTYEGSVKLDYECNQVPF